MYSTSSLIKKHIFIPILFYFFIKYLQNFVVKNDSQKIATNFLQNILHKIFLQEIL